MAHRPSRRWNKDLVLSDQGEGLDIWVMNADGTGQTNLTNFWVPTSTRPGAGRHEDRVRLGPTEQGRLHDERRRERGDEPDRGQSLAGLRSGLVAGRLEDPVRQRPGRNDVGVDDGLGRRQPGQRHQRPDLRRRPRLVADGATSSSRATVGRGDLQPLDGARRRQGAAPGRGRTSAQRKSFPDWGSRAAETTTTLEPVADTFVRAGDPDAAHGTDTTFDVYAGANLDCDRGPGPVYGLLRFDPSSLPAGVDVTGARLDLTDDGGLAQDGDPSHDAIRLNSNSWLSRDLEDAAGGRHRPGHGRPAVRPDDQRRAAVVVRGRARIGTPSTTTATRTVAAPRVPALSRRAIARRP